MSTQISNYDPSGIGNLQPRWLRRFKYFNSDFFNYKSSEWNLKSYTRTESSGPIRPKVHFVFTFYLDSLFNNDVFIIPSTWLTSPFDNLLLVGNKSTLSRLEIPLIICPLFRLGTKDFTNTYSTKKISEDFSFELLFSKTMTCIMWVSVYYVKETPSTTF